MSKIIGVETNEDFSVNIALDSGDKIHFNMQRLVSTLPYARLRNIECFRAVKFDDKSIFWETGDAKSDIIPLRFSLDSILFSLRD